MERYGLRDKTDRVLAIVEAEAELDARLYGIRNVEGFHRAVELPPGDQGLQESLRELEEACSMSYRKPFSAPSLIQVGEHGREVDEGKRRLRDSWRYAHPEWTDEQVLSATTGERA